MVYCYCAGIIFNKRTPINKKFYIFVPTIKYTGMEKKNELSNDTLTFRTPDTTNTGGTSTWDPWSSPELIDTIICKDCIELVYKAVSMITYAIHPAPPPEIKVWKDVYGVVDGKFGFVGTIICRYIPEQGESYEEL